MAHLMDTKINVMDNMDETMQTIMLKNFKTVVFGEEVVIHKV